MRNKIAFLNRLFETLKCRNEILQFLRDEKIISDDVMQNILHETHTQHASKIYTLLQELLQAEVLQVVEYEWRILPVEFIQLSLVSKTAKKDFTYTIG